MPLQILAYVVLVGLVVLIAVFPLLAMFILSVWPKRQNFLGFYVDTKTAGDVEEKALFVPKWLRWCVLCLLTLLLVFYVSDVYQNSESIGFIKVAVVIGFILICTAAIKRLSASS